MKKIGSFITGIFYLLLFFTSCKNDDRILDCLEYNTDSSMNAVFELNLTIEGNNRMSRAVIDNDSTIGNTIENCISTVQLFVVPMDNNGDELWKSLRFGETAVPKDFKNSVRVQISEISFTKINVYVGVNMNREQVEAFIRSKSGYYEMARTNFLTYYSAINQLAPFYPGWQTSSNRHPANIVMFSTSPLSADRSMVSEIKDEQTGETKKYINLGTAAMKRVVAKVLLTCASEDGANAGKDKAVAPGALPGVQYVKTVKQLLDPSLENRGPMGWIRQQNVYYFINNMPRRVKFLQEYDDKDNDGVKEPVPNYNLKKTIVDELDVHFSPIKYNRERVKTVFIHYDIFELYKRNQSFCQSKVWSPTEYENLIHDKDSEYSKDNVGMYTVENMFAVEDGDFTDEELKQLYEYTDVPFFTKIAIAAKFTPRFIFVTDEEWNEGINGSDPMKDHSVKDKKLSELANPIDTDKYNGYYLLECSSEEVADSILTLSLRMHNHLTEGEYDAENLPYMYPESTFFAFFRDNDTYYCSYGVASVRNPDGINWSEMIPFTRGWSYYYTYINNDDSSPIQHIKQICIERNNYYILKLTSIGTLGSSVSDNRYIEVHTLKSDWQYGGKGDVTIH